MTWDGRSRRKTYPCVLSLPLEPTVSFGNPIISYLGPTLFSLRSPRWKERCVWVYMYNVYAYMCTFVYVWCFGFYFDFLWPCSFLCSLDDVHLATAGVFREGRGSECFPPLNSQCVKQAFNKNSFNEKLSEDKGGCEGETRKQKWSRVCGTQRVERRNRKGEASFLRAFVCPDISHLLCRYALSLVHSVRLPFPTRHKGHTLRLPWFGLETWSHHWEYLLILRRYSVFVRWTINKF